MVMSQRYTKEVIPFVVNTSRSFPHSWLVTGCVTRLTRRVPLTSRTGAPEFIPIFGEVRVTRSLVLCVCFVDRCLSFWFFFLFAIVLFVLRFTDSDYLLWNLLFMEISHFYVFLLFFSLFSYKISKTDKVLKFITSDTHFSWKW
jgi:hypothetical protein